jgi:hypothetical protein
MCKTPTSVNTTGIQLYAPFPQVGRIMNVSAIIVNFRSEIFAKRNFVKIRPFSHDFIIFAKIEKCILFASNISCHEMHCASFWDIINEDIKCEIFINRLSHYK